MPGLARPRRRASSRVLCLRHNRFRRVCLIYTDLCVVWIQREKRRQQISVSRSIHLSIYPPIAVILVIIVITITAEHCVVQRCEPCNEQCFEHAHDFTACDSESCARNVKHHWAVCLETGRSAANTSGSGMLAPCMNDCDHASTSNILAAVGCISDIIIWGP